MYVQADLQGEVINITVTWAGTGVWKPLDREVIFHLWIQFIFAGHINSIIIEKNLTKHVFNSKE